MGRQGEFSVALESTQSRLAVPAHAYFTGAVSRVSALYIKENLLGTSRRLTLMKEIAVDEFRNGTHAEAFKARGQQRHNESGAARQGRERSEDRSNTCDFLQASAMDEERMTLTSSNSSLRLA